MGRLALLFIISMTAAAIPAAAAITTAEQVTAIAALVPADKPENTGVIMNCLHNCAVYMVYQRFYFVSMIQLCFNNFILVQQIQLLVFNNFTLS